MKNIQKISIFMLTISSFAFAQDTQNEEEELSTVEALAASLYLLGRVDQCKELLSKFRWGGRFLELNKEPLEAYAGAKSSAELVSLQFEFFDIEVEQNG